MKFIETDFSYLQELIEIGKKYVGGKSVIEVKVNRGNALYYIKRMAEAQQGAVYWFDDRLKNVSYGGIPKNITKEEFLAGKIGPVNKELMKIFLHAG